MEINRKRVAKRLVSGLVAGALALGGLAISGGSVSAKTPTFTALNRISGADRYGTSAALASKLSGTSVIVASGENYADALYAASIAGTTNAILLTKAGSIPQVVRDQLVLKIGAGANSVFIIGGESAVSASVEAEIKALKTGLVVTRLGGQSRYETAAAVAGVSASAGDKVILVNGDSFADAITASVLSAKNGWPIIPVSTDSVPAASLGAITAYTKLAGSAKDFVIVGGRSVVSDKVIEGMILSLDLVPADFQRFGGDDRFDTNLKVELGRRGTELGVQMTATKIALLTGTNWPDAVAASSYLAANDIHPMLVPAVGLGVAATSAIGLFSANNPVTGAAGAGPSALFVIGGEAAVPEATRTAATQLAQASGDLACQVTAVEGSTQVVVSFPVVALEANEQTALTVAATTSPLFLLDGSSPSVTSAPADLDLVTGNESVAVTLGAALVAGQTFTFSGLAEGTSTRALKSCSATVADDVTAPTVSIDWLGGSGVGYVVFSEKVVATAAQVQAALTTDQTVAAGATKAFSCDTVTSGRVFECQYTVDADGAGANPAAGALIATGQTVTLTTGVNFKDVSGLQLAANKTVTLTPALSEAKATAAVVECEADTDATLKLQFTGATVDITAKATALPGTLGNMWSATLSHSRGLIIPTVSVDSEAKSISVTIDKFIHSRSDVVAALKMNNTFNSNFTVAAGGAEIVGNNATANALLGVPRTALSSGTVGKDDCVATITFDQALGAIPTVAGTSSGVAITVTPLVWADMGYKVAYATVPDLTAPYSAGAITFTVGSKGLTGALNDDATTEGLGGTAIWGTAGTGTATSAIVVSS